ncbi:MAG: ribosome silencing factor [Chloroflexi bacterium]|nr:ribosome silencing factor [Chloroflexota bacterium]
MVNALEEKKGEDILLLDIQEYASFTSYFVLCTGTSDRMLDALADGVTDAVRTQHQVKPRREGKPDGGWLALDYGSIVVHILSPDRRKYYRLEELWNKGKILVRLQ